MTDDSKQRGRGDYQAPALEKGLEILELLAHEPAALSMNEIARRLSRSRNEIYRMLAVLERREYLLRLPDDRFELTNRLFWLAMRTPPRRNLHDAAMPVMHALAAALLQSCHLVVASDDEMVVVARVESPDFLGFAVRVGYRRPILKSTSGQLLFAFKPAEERERHIERLRASGSPPGDLDRFSRDVEQIRDRGFLAVPSPYVDAVTDIAVPVFDNSSSVPVAALVVPFVSGALSKTSVEDATAALREAAEAIGFALQHG